jgi:hypothetical protein
VPYRLTEIEELDGAVAAAEAEVREAVRLDRLLHVARLRREVLDGRIAALERTESGEARDVARLEGGLVAFFHRVLGTLDERRSTERQELAAVELKLAQAVAERALVDEEIADLTARAAASVGAGARASARVATARVAREQWLLAHDRDVASAVAECDREVGRLNDEAADLVHAIRVAQTTTAAMGRFLALLERGRDATVRDALDGGSARSRDAEQALEQARLLLPRIQQLLAGMDRECARMGVQVDPAAFGFPRPDRLEAFADIFFDTVVTDWASSSGITRALQATANANRLVETALLQLGERRRGLEADLAVAKATRVRALGR